MAGMFQITGSVAATSGDSKPADKDTKAEKDNKADNVEEKSMRKKATAKTGSSSYNFINSDVKGSTNHSTTTAKKTSSTSFSFSTVREKAGKTNYGRLK